LIEEAELPDVITTDEHVMHVLSLLWVVGAFTWLSVRPGGV
jgi:hypothetical protein